MTWGSRRRLFEVLGLSGLGVVLSGCPDPQKWADKGDRTSEMYGQAWDDLKRAVEDMGPDEPAPVEDRVKDVLLTDERLIREHTGRAPGVTGWNVPIGGAEVMVDPPVAWYRDPGGQMRAQDIEVTGPDLKIALLANGREFYRRAITLPYQRMGINAVYRPVPQTVGIEQQEQTLIKVFENKGAVYDHTTGLMVVHYAPGSKDIRNSTKSEFIQLFGHEGMHHAQRVKFPELFAYRDNLLREGFGPTLYFDEGQDKGDPEQLEGAAAISTLLEADATLAEQYIEVIGGHKGMRRASPSYAHFLERVAERDGGLAKKMLQYVKGPSLLAKKFNITDKAVMDELYGNPKKVVREMNLG